MRLLRNIIGLWLVQECRREWAEAGEDYDYATLAQLAADAKPFAALIDPSDERFFKPESMIAAITEFCRETGQTAPTSPGALIRCALESLALLYRQRLNEVSALSGRTIRQLHIVGGGSRNALLNQFTANACEVEVIAGPAEATALGNVLPNPHPRPSPRSGHRPPMRPRLDGCGNLPAHRRHGMATGLRSIQRRSNTAC